jgi:O-antigen/teichoic acid export membrane protein
VTILLGVLQAVLNPLVALGSAMNADRNVQGLERLLVVSSRYCGAFLVTAIIVYILFGKSMLLFWISTTYVGDVYRILLILLIAQAARNLMAPYSILLVAVGLQRKGLIPAIAEGLVNLVVSIFLAGKLGAIGVAYGTLAGAVAGILASTLFVVNRTTELVTSRRRFVKSVLVLPLSGLAAVLYFCLTAQNVTS